MDEEERLDVTQTGQDQQSDRIVDVDRHDKSPTSTNMGTGTAAAVGSAPADYPDLDPTLDQGEPGELDLEMNINIKQALQRVIEGFDHADPGAGDMSATLQQQEEEYMRRSGREDEPHDDGHGGHEHPHHHAHGQHLHHHDHQDDEQDGHHLQHHQDRHHDEIQDVMGGDRDNIFQHFDSIDVDPHQHAHDRSHTPQMHTSRMGTEHEHVHDHMQHQDQDLSQTDNHGQELENSTGKQGKSSARGTKRKRPAKVKGPIPPVDDDPSRPLTEEEIKRRQNRSRASGRVLPRGNACEFCKRRKLRCDGERPICTNCLKNPEKRQCVYVQREKKSSKRAEARVAELDRTISATSIDLTPEVILPDATDLMGEIDQEPIAGPSGTTEQDQDDVDMSVDENGLPQAQSQSQRENDGFQLAPNLGEIDLPAIDMTVTEHHDGFNTLFEQSAAAAEADHGVDGERVHEQGGEADPALAGVGYVDDQGLARNETPLQDDAGSMSRLGSMGVAEEQGEGTPGIPIRQTGQEPYLMTLANAAEVASDVPQTDQQGGSPNVPSTKRRKRVKTGSVLPEQDSVWVQIWVDLAEGMQDVGDVDEQMGGLLVGELIDIFYKRAEALFYTRSLNRLHAALVSGNRPAKCLILAILGAVAASRMNGLSPDSQTLARKFGSQFLNLAQRDFLTSLKTPDRIVDAIQAAVLITQVYYTQGKVTEGWLLITQAMRLAVSAGLHTLRLEYLDEQVMIDQQHEHGDAHVGDVPQYMTRTIKKPMVYNNLIPKAMILAPPEDTAELGERVHLFWACLMMERTGCLALGCVSSINDEDILTPWPRSISEYTYVTTIKDMDDTVASFWSSYGKQVEEGEEKPKEFWFATTLKAMSLLHTAQRYYDRATTEPEADHSTRRQQLIETLERFSVDLPVDCVQLPLVIRKRLVDRESIWIGSAIHAVRALLCFTDDPIEHVNEIFEACEFVVRLSKAMSVPERPKLDSVIVVLWYLTSQQLRGLGQMCWANGKLPEHKKANDLNDTLKESMKMLARVSPLALSYVHALG